MAGAFFGFLLAVYMSGGAFSAAWWAHVGLRDNHITTSRELLEVIVLAWILWPLILIEELYFFYRDRERKRIEKARRRRMMV